MSFFDVAGIGSVADLAGKLVDRFLPPKMDPAEKAKLQIEMQKMLELRETSVLDAQKSVIVAEMQQSDNFTKRARPSIVYMGLIFIALVHVIFPIVAWIVLTVTGTSKEMPNITLPGEFWAAWGGVCSIWVIGRSVEKRGIAGKAIELITGKK